jgi:hypothetical protein
MNTSQIIETIDTEIARLQQVRALLLGKQLKGILDKPSSKPATLAPTGKKRQISAEGRARIAAAQKARWAKAKKAA